MNSIRITLAAALAVAEIADIISSYATPGQELNPIMAAMMAAIGPHLWWVPKMAIVAAICALMLKSRRWAIPITCTVVAAIAPIWNVVRLVPLHLEAVVEHARGCFLTHFTEAKT